MNTTIKIIQGDTCQCNFKINLADESIIKEVYLSCSKLELVKKLEYDDGKYIFRLEANETQSLKTTKADYDITIKFLNDEILTGIYRGNIIILPKTNKVGDLSE